MAERSPIVVGLLAFAAVPAGIVSILSDSGGLAAALVVAAFVGGIVGIALAIAALDRGTQHVWAARLGLGLSVVALAASVVLVLALVLFFLAFFSGASQGG